MPILLGLIFVLVGGCIVLAGAGVISIGRLNAPPWVIVCIGLLFVYAGVMLWRGAYIVLNTRHELGGRNLPAPTGEVCAISPVEGIGAVIGGWIFTIVLCSFVGYMAYQTLPSDPISGIVTNLVIHPWIEIGVALIFGMTLITLGLLRYGRIPLYIISATARAGEILEARLTIKKRHIVRAFKAKLTCHALQVTRGRKNRRRGSRTVHWSFAIEGLDVGPFGQATIRIAVPPELPGATTTLAVNHLTLVPGLIYYYWILEISADVWGVDLHRTYEIPMQPALPGAKRAAQIEEQEVAAEINAELLADAEEKAQAVRTVALVELGAGKSVDAIADKLRGMGVGQVAITAGMEQIARDAASPHVAAIRDWLAHQQQLNEEMDSGRVMLLERTAAPLYVGSSSGSKGGERPGRVLYVVGTLLTMFGLPVVWVYLPDASRVNNKVETLLEALRHNDQGKALALLADGADPNVKDKFGQPLWSLVILQDPELVGLLIGAGADPNAADISGTTPLMHFAGAGDIKMIRLLLEHGADVSYRNPNSGATPLHLAAQRTPAMVELLLDSGASLDAVDHSGVTPLMLAAAYGNPGTITSLMDRGAEFELRDKQGRNAFDRAYGSGNSDNLNTLVKLARRR